MRADLKDKFRTESNWKFIIAAVFVLGWIGTLIFAPRGKDFHITSEREVRVAMQICQNSAEWVEANRSRLKIDQSRLGHIKVNGEIPKFKHVKKPQVVFIASGFDSPNMMNEIFCEITNPATKQRIYFNYGNKTWTDKVRFRR